MHQKIFIIAPILKIQNMFRLKITLIRLISRKKNNVIIKIGPRNFLIYQRNCHSAIHIICKHLSVRDEILWNTEVLQKVGGELFSTLQPLSPLTENLLATRYSIACSMSNIQTSYVLKFHEDPPCHLHRIGSSSFPSYSFGKVK